MGTPAKNDTRSRTMMSSAALASNRGSMTIVPPKHSAVFWMQVWPNAWNSGSTARYRSGRSALAPNSSAPTSTLSRMLRWRQPAPFGCPVVPEV